MKIFDTLSDLTASSLLPDDVAKLRGLNARYDNEDREFFILTPAEYGSVPDEVTDVTLANGNIAKLIAVSTRDIVRPQSVLFAASLTDQTPLGTDTPLQIEFGAAQNGPADPVELLANGDIVVNIAGTYELILLVAVSRSTAIGEAHMFFRATVDNVQIDNPVGAVLSDDNMTLITQAVYIGTFDAGAVFRAEMVRDSSGIDGGELVAHTSTVGWGASPSSSVRVYKFG